MQLLESLFHYNFLQNAVLAALLASIACGLTGAYVVSRRMVFLSGGISHASFGGIGLAFFLGIHPPLGALVFGVASAMLIQYLSDRQDVRNDSAIGILWSAGMALGIVFIYLTPGYVPNLMTYLFGNILTTSPADLWLLGLSAVLAVLAFIVFYPLVLAVAFDQGYARVRRLPAGAVNYLLMALVALTIVTSIRVTGIILVISFLTLPQAIAAIFTRRLSGLMLWSVALSAAGSIGGILLSYTLNLPSGAVIIFTFALMFILVRLTWWAIRAWARRAEN
ncbi:MAG TPA: metal ABC transporter permease [Bacteroidales bacterium]|nr:metal ABC transporter permease [Bacteroidales bacterium]